METSILYGEKLYIYRLLFNHVRIKKEHPTSILSKKGPQKTGIKGLAVGSYRNGSLPTLSLFFTLDINKSILLACYVVFS